MNIAWILGTNTDQEGGKSPLRSCNVIFPTAPQSMFAG